MVGRETSTYIIETYCFSHRFCDVCFCSVVGQLYWLLFLGLKNLKHLLRQSWWKIIRNVRIQTSFWDTRLSETNLLKGKLVLPLRTIRIGIEGWTVRKVTLGFFGIWAEDFLVMWCVIDETEYEYSGSDDDENHGQNGKAFDPQSGFF